METEPAEAVQDLRQGGRAVPDETLLFQFGVAPAVRSLGGRDFEIAGALRKVPATHQPLRVSRRVFTLRCRSSA